MRTGIPRAFTLVEILIVVVILGILAAIIVPLYNSVTTEAAMSATRSELEKLRRHVGVYRARNSGGLPEVVAGNGSWGELVGPAHFQSAPVNAWVGGVNSKMVILGAVPDDEYHTDYGWIYDPATGQVWAAGFTADDEPLPRN